jgi:hypothetical protein
MRLCIPFRVARVGISSDSQGVKSAMVSLVPKLSESPHDVTAAIWGGRYPPNGELIMHNVSPDIAAQMEPGSHANVIIEIL